MLFRSLKQVSQVESVVYGLIVRRLNLLVLALIGTRFPSLKNYFWLRFNVIRKDTEFDNVNIPLRAGFSYVLPIYSVSFAQ